MNIDQLRNFCLSMPHATEDVKWGDDLCFCVGEKMFCVTGLDSPEAGVSIKCRPEVFAELIELDGITPARYMARYHWVTVEQTSGLPSARLKELIGESYQMVFDKLPAKTRNSFR
jgi:predicted DNA-binding protein (MmcQ/YjbR family)